MNCYVLAGGLSRRLGQAKPELFLERVAAAARGAFEEVIVVQRHGGRSFEIPTIFESEHDDAAPLFGIERAIEHADGKCFVLAVDYPLITSEVLRFLRDRFTSSMLVPMWRGKAQTLCAGYSTELLPLIRSRIEAGRLDIRGLIDGAEIVEESELRARFAGEPLLNVNTPEELEEAKAIDERLLASR